MTDSGEVISVFTDPKEDGEIGLWLYNVPHDLEEHLRAGEGAQSYFLDRTESRSQTTIHAKVFSLDAYGMILDEIVKRGYRIAAVEGFSTIDHPGFHAEDLS